LDLLATKLHKEYEEEEHPLSILQPSVEHALLCIVEAVAGADAALHIDEFLEDFVDEFRMPRMPNYQ